MTVMGCSLIGKTLNFELSTCPIVADRPINLD